MIRNPDATTPPSPYDETAGIPAAENAAASFAELAEADRDQAREDRKRAAKAVASAETALVAAQEHAEQLRDQAAQVMAAAGETMQQAADIAAAAASDAEALDARAALIDRVQALHIQSEQADSRAAEYEGERDRLEAQTVGLEARLAELAEDQSATETAVAAALKEADVDGITAGRARLAAISEAARQLAGQLDAARTAASRIGDSDGPGDLAAVLSEGRAHRAAIWQALGALAGDETASPALVAIAARDRAAEAARAAAEASAEHARIVSLLAALQASAARLPAERTEIEQRFAGPGSGLRLARSRIALRDLAARYDRIGGELSDIAVIAAERVDLLLRSDPATLPDALAAASRTREHLRKTMDRMPPPLPPDDLDLSREGLAAVMREQNEAYAAQLEREAAERKPAPRRIVSMG